MALDYLIAGLQFLSAAVNVLALGAFWISPGLRTTANRFVINLLVANIVACLALTPALWLNGGLKTRFRFYYSSDTMLDEHIGGTINDAINQFEQRIKHTSAAHHHGGKVERDVGSQESFGAIVEQSIESMYIERDENGRVRKLSEKQVIDIQSGGKENDEIIEEVVEEEINEPKMAMKHNKGVVVDTPGANVKPLHSPLRAHTVFTENSLVFDCTRFWGFDLAAALGGLSVLLVVGDTWCAVTDPLRYHSRISYLKSWILIGCVWAISIVFSAISAFRSKWCKIEIDSVTERDHANGSTSGTTATIKENDSMMMVANVYAIVFSCVYFIVIILLPISIVCIMYFRIFSEARQSSQRMRRNGSSPLLQSAINLHNPAINANSLNEQQNYPSLFDVSAPDVLTMKIDHKQSAIEEGKLNEYNRKLSTVGVATHQYRRYLDIPENENEQQQPVKTKSLSKKDRTKSEKCLNGFKPKLSHFRRNFSARTLCGLEQPCEIYHPSTFLSKNQNLSRMITGEMRQVHSSPNLQKLSNLDLLHKVPYCANNRSTTSINQTAQQSATSPRALSYMISIRHRLSNASSIFKYREESRAARIGIVVVAMFMVSYLPFGLLILLQGRLTFIPNASLWSILFLLIGNMSTPFIFAYRNRRVRRGVCRLFGVDPKSNSYLQKQRSKMQLRGTQSHPGSSKHVRIHRNLSASNFSLNMLPYKFASPILPMLHGSTEQMHANCMPTSLSNGSVLVPIDDEECDNETEKTTTTTASTPSSDCNNNDLKIDEAVTVHKEKMSLFKRMRTVSSRKSSTCVESPVETEKNDNETKDDAI